MGDVVVLDMVTTLDIPPERIIQGAKEAKVKNVMVLGYDENDGFYFASSFSDGGDALWLMEKAKKLLLEIGE